MWGINSIVDLILEDIVPCEEIEDFRIVVIISCVWGKDTPIGQHISNMQTIWQLDEKSIPALKINILWSMSDSIPHLVPTHFQESIFLLITVQKYRFWLRLDSNKHNALGCYSETWSHIGMSVYGADTIAIDLSLSALISWFMK